MKIHGIIIGDEILNGNRTDKHLSNLIQALKKRGLSLHSTQYIGDDLTSIVNALKHSMHLYGGTHDIVCCFGGIGATPDDKTRQAAGLAFNQPLLLHAEAKACITQRIQQMQLEGKAPLDFNHPDNMHRFTMGEFPEQAKIIPNTYNLIPAFYVGNHYFMPGFPIMAWPMLDWILDTHYAAFHHTHTEKTMHGYVLQMPEGQLSPILFEAERLFPDIKTYSLPSFGIENNNQNTNVDANQPDYLTKPHIEVGVKSNTFNVENLTLAFNYITEKIKQLGYKIIMS
jgi:molybdopterin-biosynthesis enzyme MoeA-like protein